MAGGIRLLVAAALLVAVGFWLTGPGATDARAASCAEVVLDDWSDGRIDGTYERDCYLDAITMLPEDVRVYTSAADDIARALQARGRSRSAAGPVGAAPTGPANGPVAAESSRGIPAPVVMLLAVAVAVLAAGSAGLIARRLRIRREP
jgi:hypothetical protein